MSKGDRLDPEGQADKKWQGQRESATSDHTCLSLYSAVKKWCMFLLPGGDAWCYPSISMQLSMKQIIPYYITSLCLKISTVKKEYETPPPCSILLNTGSIVWSKACVANWIIYDLDLCHRMSR